MTNDGLEEVKEKAKELVQLCEKYGFPIYCHIKTGDEPIVEKLMEVRNDKL